MLRGVYLPDWIEKPKTDVIVALEYLAAKIDELENLKPEKVWIFDGADFQIVDKSSIKCPTCGRKKKKNG